MGLLDSDIRKIVDNAVSSLLLDATYHAVALTDNGVGRFTETETDHATKGFVDTYSDFTIANGGAQAGDYKITVIQLQLTPTPAIGDRITIDGQKYKIVAIKEDPASATWEFKARLFTSD